MQRFGGRPGLPDAEELEVCASACFTPRAGRDTGQGAWERWGRPRRRRRWPYGQGWWEPS
eukprot:5871412-Alexandrium_andersonii.AAC.1